MARTITIEPLVAAWLAGRPGFIDLAGDRLYVWGTAPEGGPFPYMLYCQTGGDRFRSTRGPTTRVSWVTIQFDAIGRTYEEATLLADAACRDLEEGLQFERLDGHKIQSVRCRLPGLDGDDPVFGDEVTQPRKTFVSKIHFEEG